jgi:hypothetical protein
MSVRGRCAPMLQAGLRGTLGQRRTAWASFGVTCSELTPRLPVAPVVSLGLLGAVLSVVGSTAGSTPPVPAQLLGEPWVRGCPCGLDGRRRGPRCNPGGSGRPAPSCSAAWLCPKPATHSDAQPACGHRMQLGSRGSATMGSRADRGGSQGLHSRLGFLSAPAWSWGLEARAAPGAVVGNTPPMGSAGSPHRDRGPWSGWCIIRFHRKATVPA